MGSNVNIEVEQFAASTIWDVYALATADLVHVVGSNPRVSLTYIIR